MKKTIRIILDALDCRDHELSVILIDDQEMQTLNGAFRGRDEPTDVLSFPMREGAFAEINSHVLGDLAISLETALRQAEEEGHSLKREVDFLLIHGILHLLGYDHELSEEMALAMQRKERELLEKVLPSPSPLAGEGRDGGENAEGTPHLHPPPQGGRRQGGRK